MIPVRQDSDAQSLRLLAGLEKVGKVVRRLLGIAHILDGRSRQEAAELVGLAPRDLTRAVKRYNAGICSSPPLISERNGLAERGY